MMGGYVDDGRQISTALDMGMVFNKESMRFEYSELILNEDLEAKEHGESENERMAKRCRVAMEAINEDLKFTTETQEEFCNERLPTLDFEVWLGEDLKVCHSYYQKPMKTPFVIMERSAMSNHQKY